MLDATGVGLKVCHICGVQMYKDNLWADVRNPTINNLVCDQCELDHKIETVKYEDD